MPIESGKNKGKVAMLQTIGDFVSIIYVYPETVEDYKKFGCVESDFDNTFFEGEVE